jgi:hypothetical protein
MHYKSAFFHHIMAGNVQGIAIFFPSPGFPGGNGGVDHYLPDEK